MKDERQNNFIEELLGGSAITITYSTIVHEITHLFGVAVSAIVATIVIHFTKKIISKLSKSKTNEEN